MEIRTKQGLAGTTTQTLGKWKTRQLAAALKKLQEAADNNDAHPIWELQSRHRANRTSNHVEIKKQAGSECHGLAETLKRWGEWAKQ